MMQRSPSQRATCVGRLSSSEMSATEESLMGVAPAKPTTVRPTSSSVVKLPSRDRKNSLSPSLTSPPERVALAAERAAATSSGMSPCSSTAPSLSLMATTGSAPPTISQAATPSTCSMRVLTTRLAKSVVSIQSDPPRTRTSMKGRRDGS